MRKTLFITLEYPPQVGGVANYHYNLIRYLPQDRILVLTNQKHELIGKWPIFPWLKSFFTIKKIIRNQKIDLILVGHVLPLGSVALLFKIFLNIPFIVFTHAMDVTYPKQFPRKKWLLKKIFNKAEKIITISRFTKYELYDFLKGNSQKKIEIICPSPSIIPESLKSFDINPLQLLYHDKKIILSVGRIVQRKGFDQTIKALPLVLKSFPNLEYIIIGEGEYKRTISDLIKKMKLELYVKLLGKLSDQETAAYYQLCDLFIMPSRELSNRDVEGFGLVFLEANSFGKPVIGGKSGGVEDAIIDGKNGFLVDPNDTEMIANAIIKILGNEQLARQMGEFGKKRVLSDFSWQLKSEQLKHLL